ncbi:MAG TPA: MFS transporter [Candidatus Acidoferrales bacterium]|nr:MFS transporter [Candidatus Acidoferrales bacterium]
MYIEIKDRRVILAVCSLAFLVGYFARLSWAILSSFSTLHTTVADNSAIFSMFFVGYSFTQLPAGFLADKVSPKKIIGVALLGLTVSTALSGFAWTVGIEIVASLMTGLAAGWIYPATVKMIAALFRGKDLSVAIGYYSLAWPSALVLTGLALPVTASTFGWRVPFYVLTLVCLMLALLIVSTENTARQEESVDYSVIKEKSVILLCVASFLFFLAYWILALYSYSYLLTLGISSLNSGLIYSTLAVAGLPATIISGHIMKRLKVQFTLASAVIMYAILLLAFSFTRDIYALVGISILIGFFRFIITPASTTLASLVCGADRAGSVNGITNFFGQASGVIGPVLASFMLQSAGYSALWIVSFALCIAAGIVFACITIR